MYCTILESPRGSQNKKYLVSIFLNILSLYNKRKCNMIKKSSNSFQNELEAGGLSSESDTESKLSTKCNSSCNILFMSSKQD